MALYEVTDHDVLQRCARCAREQRIRLEDLAVGVADGDKNESRILALPACPACKSREFLICSAENEPAHPAPGTFGDLHRLLVDHLHAELVQRGQVIDAIGDRIVARPVAPEVLRARFPHGMKIADTPGESPRAMAAKQREP